MEIPMN